MKLVITVDLSSDGKLFVKNAPKCLKRAVRAVCWPFDADVHVDFVGDDEMNQIKETVKAQGKTRGKGEKNGSRTRVAGRSKGQTGENS